MRRSDVVRLTAASVLLARCTGLDRWHPFSSLVALRPLFAGAVALSGLPPRSAPARSRIVAVACQTLAARALVDLVHRVRRTPHRPDGDGSDLTLMVLNVRDGRADPDAVARTVLGCGAGLVALTEAGSRFAERLMTLLSPHGFRSWSSVDDDRRDVDGVSLFAAPSAGKLHVRRHPDTWFPHLEARGGVLGELRLMVFHAVAPIPPGSTRGWLDDHARIAGWCREDGDVIVTGDLNSTLDHSILARALGSARDAAATSGRGLAATWPAALPRWAGLQLDHVLVPEQVRVRRLRIGDVPGTDHRTLVAELSLPAPDRCGQDTTDAV